MWAIRTTLSCTALPIYVHPPGSTRMHTVENQERHFVDNSDKKGKFCEVFYVSTMGMLVWHRIKLNAPANLTKPNRWMSSISCEFY